MAIRLPRPPANQDPKQWGMWFDAVYKALSGIVGIVWSAIDKTGSELSDIESRPHSDLQNIEAADDTSSDTTANRHISDAQAKGWTGDISALETVHTDILDPTGWIDPAAITVTYNDVDDTITLSGTLDYYWRGVKRSLTSPWTSSAHSATTGQNYYLYSTDGVNFTWSTTIWAFSDLMVSAVQHGVSDLFALREVHGCNLPWTAHEEFHRTTGTYKQSGGTLSGYLAGNTAALFRRPAVAATLVHDEDIETTIAALPDNGPYTVMTLTGSSTATFTKAAADIVPLSGNRPYWNELAGTWGQTLMTNNSYMCVWLIAVPTADGTESQKYRYIWVQGQSEGSLTSQQALFPQDLSLGTFTILSAEFVFIAKIIIRYTAANWVITSVTNLTGTRALSVGSPAGVYLSVVSTDATLIGDGTVGNPLSVVAAGGEAVPYASQYDDVGGGVAYLGEAVPGTATSAASWRIKQITTTGSDIAVLWADGNSDFDNVWNDRLTLSYS